MLQLGQLSPGVRLCSTGDNFTTAGVRRLVRQAIAQATELKHDARTYHLLKPDTPQTTAVEDASDRFDPRIAKITADDRRLAVQKIIRIARAHGLEAAGIYSPSTTFHAIGNSNGLFRLSRESSLECSVTALSPYIIRLAEGVRSISGWH